MTDNLLTAFRSEVPLPDEATAQRIYRRATSGRQHVVTRRRLVGAVAVLAAAAIAGALSATLGGEGSKPPVAKGPGPGRGGFGVYANNRFTFNRDGQKLTSIDVTVSDQNWPDATLYLEVLYRDASEPANVDEAKTERVFEETVPMTATGATGDDAVLSTWSGTLSPSDWNGGCQDGFYVIWTAAYPTGSEVVDPFNSKNVPVHFEESNAWFSCGGS